MPRTKLTKLTRLTKQSSATRLPKQSWFSLFCESTSGMKHRDKMSALKTGCLSILFLIVAIDIITSATGVSKGDHDVFSSEVNKVVHGIEDVLFFEAYYKELTPYLNVAKAEVAKNSSDFDFVFETDGRALCSMYHKYKGDSPKPRPKHLIVDGLYANFGALSATIEDRTVGWMGPESIVAQRGCSLDQMSQHLDRPEALGMITTQHQYNFIHRKAHSLPVGLSSESYTAIFTFLQKIQDGSYSYASKCVNRDLKWLVVNFDEGQSKVHRPKVAKLLSPAFGPNTFSRGRSQDDFLTEVYCSRFVACPCGMGFDTHRVWEALTLGRIPILERHSHIGGLLATYADLPVLLVDKWEDVTQELLEKSWKDMASKAASYKYEKLVKAYWVDFIYGLMPEEYRPPKAMK
jgi:hypothetical protein